MDWCIIESKDDGNKGGRIALKEQMREEKELEMRAVMPHKIEWSVGYRKR